MHAFAYAGAETLSDAAAAAAATPAARLLAGGTDLVPELTRRLGTPPSLLIDLKRAGDADPALRAIGRLPDGTLRIGALVTLAEIAEHALVARGPLAALAEACASAASPALRNMATIGGNLLQAPRCWYFRAGVPCAATGAAGCPARDGDARFHAIFPGEECIDVHPSDPATALALFEARVEVQMPGAANPHREVTIADLLSAPTAARPRFHALAPGDVVSAVLVPPPPDGTRSVYEKGMSREVWSFALASVAALATPGGAVAFALGGVAARPIVTSDLEATLAAARPHPTNRYKIDLVRGLAARARERLGVS